MTQSRWKQGWHDAEIQWEKYIGQVRKDLTDGIDVLVEQSENLNSLQVLVRVRDLVERTFEAAEAAGMSDE